MSKNVEMMAVKLLMEMTEYLVNIQVNGKMNSLTKHGRKTMGKRSRRRRRGRSRRGKRNYKELIKKTENDGDWCQMCVLSLQPISDDGDDDDDGDDGDDDDDVKYHWRAPNPQFSKTHKKERKSGTSNTVDRE